MVSSSVALLGAVLLAASPAPTPAARRVAVLDFNASWAGSCAGAATANDAQRERCEILRLFADQARAGALSLLRPPGFVVMTRENTAQILKDMGGQCSEGECEVETARLLGASVVLSGEVTLLEGTYIVSLKVHDVASAALLGTGNTEAKSKLEAFRNVRAETERMLRSTEGLTAAAAIPVAPPPPAARPAPAPAPPPASVAKVAQPAAEDARTEPESTPPSAPSGQDPAAPRRRWWVELLGGVRLAQTQSGIDFVGPDTFKRDSGGALAAVLRGGFAWRPDWAAEVTVIPGLHPTGYQAKAPGVTPEGDYLEFDFSTALGVGVAFRPRANPYFSVAVGGGAGKGHMWLYAEGGSQAVEASSVGPFFYGDLRFEYPLGNFSVGAQVSAMILVNGKNVTASNVGATHSVTFDGGGSIKIFPVFGSVKYRF